MKWIRWCREHYILSSLLLSLIGAMIGEAAYMITYFNWSLDPEWLITDLWFMLYALIPLALLICYPIVITLAELILLVVPWRNGALRKQGNYFDLAALFLGVPYSLVFMSGSDVRFDMDWTEAIFEFQMHAPIYTHSAPTVIVLTLLGFAGYLILTYVPLPKLPPLAIVGSIAGMYLACGIQVLWAVQVVNSIQNLLLLLLPACVLMMAVRTIRDVICAWNALPHEGEKLKPIQSLLQRAALWPVLGLVAAVPMMGILIAVLALFGQAPNEAIRAFTETADWNLSQRIPPQSLPYDGHYLCTVAAGGHEKVVKPRRYGVRHGHRVVVNRQLCVANAFEQVLEERTPRLHRHVRHFYDTYGLPVAKLIHSKWTADLVYFVMKPLEWLFLLVLYSVDTAPESRIAIQYTGKSVHDFERTAL